MADTVGDVGLHTEKTNVRSSIEYELGSMSVDETEALAVVDIEAHCLELRAHSRQGKSLRVHKVTIKAKAYARRCEQMETGHPPSLETLTFEMLQGGVDLGKPGTGQREHIFGLIPKVGSGPGEISGSLAGNPAGNAGMSCLGKMARAPSWAAGLADSSTSTEEVMIVAMAGSLVSAAAWADRLRPRTLPFLPSILTGRGISPFGFQKTGVCRMEIRAGQGIDD